MIICYGRILIFLVKLARFKYSYPNLDVRLSRFIDRALTIVCSFIMLQQGYLTCPCNKVALVVALDDY
jgi:hypothetical protein